MRLKARHEPFWRSLDRGLHLGYRKGPRGGVWRARAFLEDRGGERRYHKTIIGVADDTQDADGHAVLNFSQAQAQARDWYAAAARHAAGLEAPADGRYTVKQAIDDYLAAYERRGKSPAATKAAASAHITPALGEIALARLTATDIRKWLDVLAARPARLRSRRNATEPKHRKPAGDHDAKRRRQATANRVLTILKAALNHAWQGGKASSDEAWRKVRPFKHVDVPVVRYLTGAESVRLVNACDVGFRPLVQAALLTGCRYGELIALHAGDFNEDAGTLTIRTSKSGKARHVVLTNEGQQFFAEATTGKARTAPIFARPDGEAWGKSHQQRPLTEACKRAKITPAISFHVLRHTHGSTLAMRGVPLPVIAKQLGHADTRMTERHYAHLAPNYVADTIRANFPTLGIVPKSNVKRLGRKPRLGSRVNGARRLQLR
jgi:integrase